MQITQAWTKSAAHSCGQPALEIQHGIQQKQTQKATPPASHWPFLAAIRTKDRESLKELEIFGKEKPCKSWTSFHHRLKMQQMSRPLINIFIFCSVLLV